MVHDFQGFEDWPADELVAKILGIITDDTLNSRKFTVIGMKNVVAFVKSMVDNEDDVLKIRDRIGKWDDALADEAARVIGYHTDRV